MKKLYAVIAQDTKDNSFDVMEVTFDLEEAKKEARWQKALYKRERKHCRDFIRMETILVTYPYEFQQDDDMWGLWDAAEDWYSYGEYEAVNF